MKTRNLLLTAVLLSPICGLAAVAQASKPCPSCPTCPKGPSDPETWLSFLPVIFFLLILIITTIKLRNDKTKLSDLLAEKDTPVTGGGDANAPAATQTSSQSVSRFIAFLTGLVALTIGICITSFYMYSYFSNPAAKIDFSNFTNVIWGLGIGVLPYGFNKASAAVKSNT